jgi:hypothetical protein
MADRPGYPSKPRVVAPPTIQQPKSPPAPKAVPPPTYSHLKDRLGHD